MKLLGAFSCCSQCFVFFSAWKALVSNRKGIQSIRNPCRRSLQNRWKKGKERKEYLYSAIYTLFISRSAQAWITQLYLLIHRACLSFVNVHYGATPNWITAYYSSIDPKGMKGWVGLVITAMKLEMVVMVVVMFSSCVILYISYINYVLVYIVIAHGLCRIYSRWLCSNMKKTCPQIKRYHISVYCNLCRFL